MTEELNMPEDEALLNFALSFVHKSTHHSASRSSSGTEIAGGSTVDSALHSPPIQLRATQSANAETMPRVNLPGFDVRYDIRGKLGEGGIGTVYLACDTELGREVAIKVLREQHTRNAGVVSRFIEEAQICGQLNHPAIIPIHELGLWRGRVPFFVMKHVKGRTFEELISRPSHAGSERLRNLSMFERVCQAVGYAHTCGVIHRDLKPANVMVGSFGEVHVMDWGMAKVLDRAAVEREVRPTAADTSESPADSSDSGPGSSAGSVSGSVMGTLAYLAPEQARGEVDKIDERTDVFGLGATLCEILTGLPPYVGIDARALRAAARQPDLAEAFARLDNCGAERELVALVRRCLCSERSGRPLDANEVAKGIAAYLSGVDERAQEAHVAAALAGEQLGGARRVQRLTLAAATASLISLGLGVGGYLWIESENDARRTLARENANAALSKAHRQFGDAKTARDDLGPWNLAVRNAEHAKNLSTSPDVDHELSSRAIALLTDIQAEREGAVQRNRDEAMQRRLIEVLVADDEDRVAGGWSQRREPNRIAREYGEAFEQFLDGSNLDELSVKDAVATLSRSDIALDLALALDDWAMQIRKASPAAAQREDSGSRHRRAIARGLDPDDSWRNNLRTLLDSQLLDRAALMQLAEGTDWDQRPATSFILLGQALWEVGAQKRAVAIYNLGHDRYPDHFALAFRTGAALLQMADARPAKAEIYFRLASASRPEWKEARLQIGWAKLKQGDLDGASAVFERLLKRDGDYPIAWIGIGAVRFRRGEFTGAADCFRRAITLSPRSAVAHGDLGLALEQQGDLGQAVRVLREALALDPESGRVHHALGRVLRKQGKHEDAITCCRKAIKLGHDTASVYWDLAGALFGTNQWAAASKNYRHAIKLRPGFVEAYVNLGYTLRRMGDYEESVRVLRRAIALDKVHAKAHLNLGLALARQGKLDEAIARLQQAVALDPVHRATHGILGELLMSRGRLVEAEAALRREIELKGKVDLALFNLGRVHLRRGDAKSAVASFDRVISVARDPNTMFEHVANTLSGLDTPAAAIAVCRTWKQLRPNSPWGHCQMASVLRRNSKLREAETAYVEAIRLNSDCAIAWCGLGAVLITQSRFAEALAANIRGHELGDASPHWRAKSKSRVEQARKLVERETRLLPILDGNGEEADSGDLLFLLGCAYARGRHRDAVRMFRSGFSKEPALAADLQRGYRYNASCSAVLAAAGESETASAMNPAHRSELRMQAVRWLRADLDAWRRLIAADDEARPMAIHRARMGLENDTDLATIRDPELLRRLPASERTACSELWRDYRRWLKDLVGGR